MKDIEPKTSVSDTDIVEVSPAEMTDVDDLTFLDVSSFALTLETKFVPMNGTGTCASSGCYGCQGGDTGDGSNSGNCTKAYGC